MDLRSHLDENYGKNIFGFSQISIEKVNNAKEKYAHNVDIKDIVLLIDDTVFGSAKCGVLITSSGLYIKEDFEKPAYFSFDKIDDICMKRNILTGLYINNKRVGGFTQPSYKSLKIVFEKLNEYIDYYNSDNQYISIENLPNTLDVSEIVNNNEAVGSIKLYDDSTNNQTSKNTKTIVRTEREEKKSNIVVKVLQSYFKTLFTQPIDFKTRTSNAWLYIFSVINFYVISKTLMGAMTFVFEFDTSPIIIIKFVIACLCFISSFSIMVRRLHDINKPGWLLIIGLIFPPVLIILAFMFLFPGTKGTNKYGKDPRSLPYWYLR